MPSFDGLELLSEEESRSLLASSNRGMVEGLCFEASDVEWSRGSGATVRAGAAALMLSLAGRDAALDELVGDGADEFRRRCEKLAGAAD